MVSVFSFVVGISTAMLLSLFAYWCFWRFYFLRDPPRKIPPGDVLVSPADGKVIAVRTYDFRKDDKVVKIRKGNGRIRTLASEVADQVTVISIFMSPLDVHVNRAPCDGKIVSTKHTKGKFYSARNLKKSLENEKNELLMEASFGKAKVIQIAGYLARRIECFVREGQEVKKGQRIGLINLGSQVTLILPSGKIKVKTRVGKKVKAGSSILAEAVS